MKQSLIVLIAALAAVSAVPARAAVQVTEIAPWSSGNSPLGADWFELTNTGASAVSIAGWTMDDDSATLGSSVALTGVASINAGESVIFIEGDGSANATFLNIWFGNSAPAGLQIGNYSGSKVGLSASGDAVTIFNAAGIQQTIVTFGGSPGGPYPTFDNAAGLSGAISQLSVAGVNGAFVAVNDANEIGSPGTIAAVPEADTYTMMLAGLGLIGFALRKRQA